MKYVPLTDLIDTIETIAGLDFVQLGLINVANGTDDGLNNGDASDGTDSSIQADAAIANITVNNTADGTSTITVTNADGTVNTAEVQIADFYMDYITSLLFDANGNSRLSMQQVHVGQDGTIYPYAQTNTATVTSIKPIVLTTGVNNGGTEETGYTTAGNDLIVAGRLDLLHGAYIDAGEGVNTLEIDAKGYFAQPKELLNIQHIKIENLPNVYTNTDAENDFINDYPVLDTTDAVGNFANSIIDISRAGELETLTITEGQFEGLNGDAASGDLTVAGVRNNAELILEGAFEQDLTVHYSEGMSNGDNGVNITLRLGDTDGATFKILQNSATVNINSQGGGNAIDAAFAPSSLMNLNISGDAKLQIAADLAPQFQENTPAFINASANTAGVDLTIGDGEAFSDEVHFIGSTGNDHLVVGAVRNVTVMGQNGDNEFEVQTQEDITITSGAGNNQIIATSNGSTGLDNEDVVTVTVGSGNNDITVSAVDKFVVTAGDGANRIEATATQASTSNVTEDDYSSIMAGNGQNEIDVSAAFVNVTAGNGANEIAMTNAKKATITTGTGNDVINASAVAGSSESITISAADGNNTITTTGFETVTVTTGTGNDSLTINGGNAQLDSENNAGELVGENGSEILINVNLGSGTNTLVLGSDGASDNGVTAMDGSVITGSNITLKVESDSDLSRATLTGVTAVQITNADVLTITVSQFEALGASAFSLLGASLGANGVVNLIVDKNTNATTLGLDNLPRNLDVSFEVMDGMTLTMTAQQLHERVTNNGVTGYTDNNGDMAVGTVHITNAGEDFSAFDDQPLTGSVDEDADLNIRIDATPSGFERPEAATTYTRIVIDTDTLTNGIQTPFDTAYNFLRITGDADMVFTPVAAGIDEWGQPIRNAGDSIELGTDDDSYLVDFSSVTGTVSGLTLARFDKVSAIYGNGDARVDVKVAGDGQVASAEQGLVSSGISTFVVTDVATVTEVDFYTCETTKDLTTLGIQGLAGETVNFLNTERGVNFLIETEYSKANGYVAGTLNAEFARAGADAVVNVVAKNAVPAGQSQVVQGIDTANASTLTVNVTGGNTVISTMAGVDAPAITLNASNNLTVTTAFTDTIKSIDASGVVGNFTASTAITGDDDFTFVGSAGTTVLTFTASTVLSEDSSFASAGGLTLNIDGVAGATVDLTAADLSGVDAITVGANDTVIMTIAQTVAMGESNITGTGTLTLVGLGEEAFSLANYDQDLVTAGVALTIVDVDANGVVTLNAATDLTNVASLTVPAGVTLNLTAAQFQQLQGAGTITGAASTTNYTVNITGLTQADMGTGATAGLSIASITAANVSITLAEDVAIADANSDLANTGALTINIGNDMTFAHNDTSDLDGATINGGTNSTLRLTETANAATAVSATNWDITTLQIDQAYVAGQNVDGRFTGLKETVTKEIYSDFGVVVGQDQIVNLEAGMTVTGALTFNRVETNVEIENFTLNMQGGVILNGNLDLRSNDENNGTVDFLHAHLQSLTINSTGTAENEVFGGASNIITGSVTAVGADDETQNNLLNVTINATQALEIQGDFVVTSAAGDDAYVIGDDTAATATITVNGTANVDLGTLDSTDDDVDAVVVNNAGTGTVTVGLDAAKLDQTANNTDSLSFTGSNINLQIAAGADVNLSNDNLSGVTTITVGTAADTVNSSVTLTQAQYDGLTLVNGTDADTVMTLNLVAFGSDVFDATAADADAITITMAAGINTLNPATNLTGVTSITVPEGGTLNLTAAQFQQLNGAGTINILNTDGNGGNDAITVNITDLTQADIFVDADADGAVDAGENFSLANVVVGANGTLTVTQAASAATITLGVFNNEGLTTQALDANSIANLNGAAYIMGANQTLELVTSVQADGLDVTGGAGSAVKFRFDALNAAQVDANNVPSIDVSGYDVAQLHTMNTMYNTANAGLNGEQNVEVILSNLDSAVELVIYNDPLALGLVDARNRVVTIEADTVVNGELVFNDIKQSVELTSLTINLEGDAGIAGDLRIPTVDEGANLQAANFGTLTINSNGTANSITGNITAEAGVDVPTTVADIENRLLNVVINADADMVIGTYGAAGHTSGGDIIFTSLVDGGTANLTVNGTANVTMHGVDTTDNDDNGATVNTADIAVLNITNNSTGTLTMTGGSEAITATGTQTINFIGAGDIVLGSDDADLNNNQVGETGDGVASTTLTAINASTMTGDLTLDTLLSVNTANFTFTAGTGVTSLTVEANDLDSTGVDTIAGNADDTAGWTFNMTNAANGSELHLNFVDPTTLVDGSKLTVLADNSTTIYIDKTMDLSDLDLSLPAGVNIVLADGATLTLTAAQASGLTIIGENGVDSTGVVTIVEMMNSTAADPIVYNFAGISADVAGVATLGEADVTLNAATDLGTFTVQLTDLENDANSFAGQTIRFATTTQADNAVRVGATAFDGDTDTDSVSSTNVVWLFDTVAAPVNTSGYDAEIGRLWLNQTLANGANIEQLFTSLPSTIVRVDFATLAELEQLLTSGPVDRVVELASFTSLPAGLTFVDENVLEHVRTLTISMGGEVEVGDLVIGNVIDNTATYATPVTFNGLTINSVLADDTGDLLAADGFDETVNVKPTSGNTIGDISVGATATNNTAAHIDLTSVIINTGAAESGNDTTTSEDAGDNVLTGTSMTIGTITFDSETAGSTATFQTTGANDVTVASLNTTDAQIATLVIDHDSTGTLTITGASPAAAVGATETLLISAAGDVIMGTAGDATKPGVDGGNVLSNITVTGNGVVNLGELQNIDDADFTLVGATAVAYETADVNLTLGDVTDIYSVTINGETFTHTIVTGNTITDVRDALIAAINASATLAVTASADGNNIDLVADNAGEHITLAAAFTNNAGAAGTGSITAAVSATSDATVATLHGSNDLSATGAWAFSNTVLTIADGVTAAAGGELSLNAVNLFVNGNINLSTLGAGLTITGGTIEVLAGATLTLTAAQATGLTITGAGTVAITEGAATLAADLGSIMTSVGDSGTVTLAISTADDADGTADADALPDAYTFTGTLGVADVTVTGTGSLTLDAAVVTTGADRDGNGATANDLPSFVVTGATLNLTATQANDLSISGTGTTAVDIDGTARVTDSTADLSGITSTTRTALVSGDTTLASTANLGTVIVSVDDGIDLTAPYTVVTGKTINEVAAPAGTGTLSVLLAATDAAADINTITTNMADTQRTAIVTDTMTFTGNFDGANVVVNADTTADNTADTVTLTTSADRLSGLTVTGVNTGAEDTLNLVITGLASNLTADLNGITGFDSITASFATTGIFTGTLPTGAVITVEDGVVMTTNATNATVANFVENTDGTGTDGTLTVTVGAADAGVNLNLINDNAITTGTNQTEVAINSITVTENLAFTGTFHSTIATGIADGVTVTVADTSAPVITGLTFNATGVTGSGILRVTDTTPANLTLAGSANFIIDSANDNVTATSVTGDLDVTLAAAAGTGIFITTAGGTNTIDASSLTDGESVTILGDDDAEVTVTAGDVDANTATGNITFVGGNGTNAFVGGDGDDIFTGAQDNDTFTGGAGNDTFNVDADTDTITDLTNGDVLVVTGAANAIASINGTFIATASTSNTSSGTATINIISDGLGLDLSSASGTTGYIVNGSADSDIVIGSDFGDTITGNAGIDQITLGDEADNVVLNQTASADVIASFTVGEDTIQLSLAAYAAVGVIGGLDPNAFVSGDGIVGGGDADDRIAYNTTTGDLYYDADGNGGGAAVLIATLTGAPVVTAGNFEIIA
ncbi:MAG TPA: hypothetical protein PLU46_00055 [Thiotrichales bacterium]|nr:hypothetical protein [Thiotrichales bacterium]